MLLQIFFGVAVVCWGGMCIGALYHLRWARRLPSLAALSRTDNLPNLEPVRCSVVIAARDEAERIERTCRRLLAQTGLEIELIVVDDRSTDGTGDRLRRLAQDESRLRVERVESLPEEWLGKCYACHVGASTASG